jgi:hypothetical protein
VNPRFGAVSPDSTAIAQAVGRKLGAPVQPAGSAAANALGLSTQVPAHDVFVTTASKKPIHIGRRQIRFQRTSPRFFITHAGSLGGVAVQALRYLGKDAVDSGLVRLLRARLSKTDKATLQRDASALPDWMRPVINQLSPRQ